MLLFSDVSELGWRAHFQELLASRSWSQEERHLHINLLEICAILLALCLPGTIDESHLGVDERHLGGGVHNKQGGMESLSLYFLARQVLA